MSPASRPGNYITADRLHQLRSDLSARDWKLLRFLSRHSYATTTQLQRMYFHSHATPNAATRAAVRVLDRLLQHHLVTRLERKIGGHTRGSAAYIWHLDAAGERLTRKDDGPRRRYVDPSLPFLEHTLQITETAVVLHELSRSSDVQLTRLEVETMAWRNFLTRHGTTTVLKPDLFATLSTSDYDDHWYLEIDRGTESLPVLLTKCRTYTAYRATGRAQTEHGVFPRVLWIVPTLRRADRLQAAIDSTRDLPSRLFTIITPADLERTLREPLEPAAETSAANAERRNP